jgi:hypothetical protein
VQDMFLLRLLERTCGGDHAHAWIQRRADAWNRTHSRILLLVLIVVPGIGAFAYKAAIFISAVRCLSFILFQNSDLRWVPSTFCLKRCCKRKWLCEMKILTVLLILDRVLMPAIYPWTLLDSWRRGPLIHDLICFPQLRPARCNPGAAEAHLWCRQAAEERCKIIKW